MLYIIFPFFQVWQYVVFNQDRNLSLSRSKEEIKGDEESKTQKLNMKKKKKLPLLAKCQNIHLFIMLNLYFPFSKPIT